MPTRSARKPLPVDDRVCPECRSDHLVRDDARGEVVCDACGLVLSDRLIDEGPEWGAFSVEENERLARTGPPKGVLQGASDLMTVVPLAGKDARGRAIPHDQRATLYRIGKLQRMAGRRSPRERTAPYVARFLARIASQLDLPSFAEDEARFLCRRVLRAHCARGRSIDEIVAAAVYAACRIDGVPRTLDELEAVTGLQRKSIGRTYRVFRGVPNLLRAPPPRASDYVDRFCSKLDLSGAVRAEARRILMECEGTLGWRPVAPAGMAAAAIYVASEACGEARTQKAVADVAGVSEITIRSRLRELKGSGEPFASAHARAA